MDKDKDGNGGDLELEEDDEDEETEIPDDPVSKKGEIYLLGPHVLMCGDSTSRDDVKALLGKSRPELMATDPPYGVLFKGTSKLKTKRASIAGDLSQSVIPISFSLALDFLDENARIYLCGGTTNFSMYEKLFDHHLQSMPHVIVWVKDGFVMRPNGYHSQFELIYWGWKGKGGGLKDWHGDRKQSDVWSVKRDNSREYIHPTQKPVELFARMIRNSCSPAGLVYEPFGGSGACLIACAKEGRTAKVMEMDPGYCDAIRIRWGKFARSNGIDPGPGAL